MTGTDINLEEESPTTEEVSKIFLAVETNEEGEVNIKCNYSHVSSVLILQTIAYMLDTAYKGDEKIMRLIAEQIPEIITEYCRLKNLQEEIEGDDSDRTGIEEKTTDSV